MPEDDIIHGGKISIHRLIGRIVGGDPNLPSVEDLTALDVPRLQLLLRLVRDALRASTSHETRSRLRDFLHERLDRAVRLKFTRTFLDAAKALIRIRAEALEAQYQFNLGVSENPFVINEAAQLLHELKNALGGRHAAMIELQAKFMVNQLDKVVRSLRRPEVDNILLAMALVEAAMHRGIAERFFEVYGISTIVKSSDAQGDGGITKRNLLIPGSTTLYSEKFLRGDFGQMRMACILVHELVHVGQKSHGSSGGSSGQINEGRPYGVDWHVANFLGDKKRVAATVAFMKKALKVTVNEAADYCVTCAATHVLSLQRRGEAQPGLPGTLTRSKATADKLYLEMMSDVPQHYSTELDTFLLALSKEFRHGALDRAGWIARIASFPSICKEKLPRSTLFDNIEDGTFAELPSNLQ